MHVESNKAWNIRVNRSATNGDDTRNVERTILALWPLESPGLIHPGSLRVLVLALVTVGVAWEACQEGSGSETEVS
jgi:hypothetical protein